MLRARQPEPAEVASRSRDLALYSYTERSSQLRCAEERSEQAEERSGESSSARASAFRNREVVLSYLLDSGGPELSVPLITESTTLGRDHTIFLIIKYLFL